jgi:large subunit ribosomal protein L23
MNITRPILSEKTLALAARGWYTFAAPKHARKEDIARDVAGMFHVTVTRVRTIAMMGKTRRVGRLARPIIRSAWKKALVTLAKGQTIDVFEVAATQEGESK